MARMLDKTAGIQKALRPRITGRQPDIFVALDIDAIA